MRASASQSFSSHGRDRVQTLGDGGRPAAASCQMAGRLGRWLVSVRHATTMLALSVSLMLCLTVAVLWVRSYWRSDVISYNTTNRTARQRKEYRIDFGHGALFVQRTSVLFSTPESVDVYLRDIPMEGLKEGVSHFARPPDAFMVFDGRFPTHWGFGVRSRQYAPDDESVTDYRHYGDVVVYGSRSVGTVYSNDRALTCPLWFVMALSTVIPALGAVATLRRRYRRKNKLCARCGYPLRGNVSGVCPECGSGCMLPRPENRDGPENRDVSEIRT